MPSHFLHLMWQENFENPNAYTHKKEQVQLLIPVGINDQHKKKKKAGYTQLSSVSTCLLTRINIMIRKNTV